MAYPKYSIRAKKPHGRQTQWVVTMIMNTGGGPVKTLGTGPTMDDAIAAAARDHKRRTGYDAPALLKREDKES